MALKTKITVAAEGRTTKGKGPARQLRLNGKIPAVVYGRGRDPEPLTVSLKEMERTLATSSANAIIDLDVSGSIVKALIREVQRHPFRPGILHVDFYEIHEGETITLSVPIRLVGIHEGVRNLGGVLDQVLREIEIQVLPKNIPEHIDLDVTALGVAQSLSVSDLNIENATILQDLNRTVCTVVPPRVDEEAATAEDEEEEETGAEPELIRKPKEEGEDEGEA